MAFRKKVITSQGFEASDAYHRVEGVRLVGKTEIKFQLRAYKNKEVSHHFSDDEFSAPYSLLGENPIAQAYAHLKTLSEFAGAVDC